MKQELTSSSQLPLDHSFSADAMKAAKPSASELDGTRLNAAFDYLENVAFAATVCNKEGIVLYQNAVARQRDGEVTGKNLYNCHSPKSGEKIRMMMETGMSNSYEVVHHGKHYFVHHTPWFAKPGGELSGLIELDIEIPENHPTFNRDKQL